MLKSTVLLALCFVISTVTCAQGQKIETFEAKAVEVDINKEMITVSLIVLTSSDELGGFDVTLEFDPEIFEFVNLTVVDEFAIEMKYKYFKDKNLIKIIGTSDGATGIIGRQKLAYIFLKNLKNIPITELSESEIKLFKNECYSTYPEFKELSADFVLSISQGIISR